MPRPLAGMLRLVRSSSHFGMTATPPNRPMAAGPPLEQRSQRSLGPVPLGPFHFAPDFLATRGPMFPRVSGVASHLGIAHQALVPTKPGWLIEVEAIAII